MESQRVLIPVEFPDPDRLPDTLIEAIGGNEVVLLGWHDTDDPDETTPEFRRRMEAHLHEEAARILRAGSEVSVDIHEGGDEKSVRERIAEENDVNAIYVPRPIDSFGRLLVPMRGQETTDEIVEFLSGLNLNTLVHLTLFHVASDEDDTEEAESLLADAKARLDDAGMSPVSIDTEIQVDKNAGFAIGEKAKGYYDAVVIGQTKDPVVDGIFGETYERIADRAEEPVIVVQRD